MFRVFIATALLLHAQATLTVRTELVVVPVTVTDDSGQPVLGLTQDDFTVYEDRRPRPITAFYQGDVPITLGVIVDRSQSMRAKGAALAVALSALLDTSRPDDELFGVVFHDEALLVRPRGSGVFTADAMDLATAVFAVPAGGRTALYDGVTEGFQQLALGKAPRRALVVISDGGDNASAQRYGDILARARRSQVSIYGIGLLGTPPATDDDDGRLLDRLSAATGGVAYFPRSTGEAAEVAHLIARDLRAQYTVGFAPDPATDDGSTRRIDVVVAAPGAGALHVRARSSYTRPNPADDPR